MHKQKQHITLPTMKTRAVHEANGVQHHHVTVHDPYASPRHVAGRISVRAFTGFLEWYLKHRPSLPFDHTKNLARKLSYVPKGMRAWAKYMPGGFATYYASEPVHGIMEDGVQLDIVTRNFFKHTYDAVGLRSRTAVLAALVFNYIRSRGSAPIRWVSIAGGAGQHVMSTIRGLPTAVRDTIHWTMIDSDPVICDFARRLYENHGPHVAHAEFLHGDIFDDHIQKIVEELAPDVVDIMGLLDYLDDKQVTQLVKAVYGQLVPGAIMILSNMNDTRPHLHVHQRAVGWPGVIPRSAEQIASLLKRAGIDSSSIATYCPQDKVYTVCRVEKT